MTADKEGLPASVRRAARFRQYLIQACWNFEGMQNVGFAYAMMPVLRHLYGRRPDDLRAAVKRHLEFFNTNPVLSGVVLGASSRMEERVAAGEADPRAIGTFKVGMMGSLGAIGDSYFWGALKPAASVTGALLAFIHPVLGVAALLLVYNIPHLSVRDKGYRKARDGGEAGAASFLKDMDFAGRAEGLKVLVAVGGGAFAGLHAGKASALAAGPYTAAAVVAVSALSVATFTILFRKAVSPSEALALLFTLGGLLLLVR